MFLSRADSGCQIMENLECRNVGTDWGDREGKYGKACPQRKASRKQGGTASHILGHQIVLVCFRIWTFPEKPPHAQQKVSCSFLLLLDHLAHTRLKHTPRSCRWMSVCSWGPASKVESWAKEANVVCLPPKAAKISSKSLTMPRKRTQNPQAKEMTWNKHGPAHVTQVREV